MTIEVCHKLYETTQTMVCFIGLNLCIGYICMCLESFNITEVKTSLGKTISRDFFGQNEECLLICVVCLQRLVSNEFLLLQNLGNLFKAQSSLIIPVLQVFILVNLCSPPQQAG